MKKFSTKSFKEMQIVRESDDYKSLMDKVLLLGELAQRASLNSFVFQAILNICNLKSAEMFGYSDERDYRDFLFKIKCNRDALQKWYDLNSKSIYADDVGQILDDLDALDEEDEEEEEDC